MYTQKVTIINKLGLHARPAGNFAKLAKTFESDIKLAFNNKNSVAKSILGVMGLNVNKGDVVELSAEGKDEKEAVESLIQFIKDGCGE